MPTPAGGNAPRGGQALRDVAEGARVCNELRAINLRIKIGFPCDGRVDWGLDVRA